LTVVGTTADVEFTASKPGLTLTITWYVPSCRGPHANVLPGLKSRTILNSGRSFDRWSLFVERSDWSSSVSALVAATLNW
jgi:hypothetical protein